MEFDQVRNNLSVVTYEVQRMNDKQILLESHNKELKDEILKFNTDLSDTKVTVMD